MPDKVIVNRGLLGKAVDFGIDMEDGASHQADLVAMFDDMVGHINGLEQQWSQEQADTFRLTDKLVIFRKNKYQGKTMTRSYMAQKERIFFWTFDEFRNWEPGRRRPTAYYHDAWHVQQFISDGPAPNDQEVLIDREVDAMRRQLAVATLLQCDQVMIDDLTDYTNNRERIRARLTQGVGIKARIVPHFTIFA